MSERSFFSTRLPAACELLAPDGSEIRCLPATERGSMVHCRLPPGAVSKAVRHRTVEEIWYVLAGRGELWRSRGQRREITPLEPATAHTIPLGTAFQFRNTGDQPLDILIVTMPPWPGAEEAVRAADHWPAADATDPGSPQPQDRPENRQ